MDSPKQGATPKYYVYELIDPRDGSVFYVGKGCRDRYAHHEAAARAGSASEKSDRINAILAGGDKIECRIVQRFDSEVQAYRFESLHIASIGLENLTNILPGGAGGRVKGDSQILAERGAEYVRALTDWMRRGSVAKIAIGNIGVLDLAAIADGWRESIADIIEKVGLERLADAVGDDSIILEYRP